MLFIILVIYSLYIFYNYSSTIIPEFTDSYDNTLPHLLLVRKSTNKKSIKNNIVNDEDGGTGATNNIVGCGEPVQGSENSIENLPKPTKGKSKKAKKKKKLKKDLGVHHN